MYTKFFGLNEKPFRITPDPRYLFMSERHSEGLAHLVYGVKDSSGFIQLTGEVGTGKTTLVRTLLMRIPDGVDVALILNPQLSALEFVTAICEELKIPLPDDRNSTKSIVDALNRHLLASHAQGRRTILIIDEAQNLATGVLEQIRLLTNLETAKQKLLQIILIAQPELRDKLSQTNMRQLAQRVTGRYHLEPLSRDETYAYIDHRLKVAGALGEIFDDRAKREVYRIAKGVPRVVNVICDRALLGAYSQEMRTVSPTMVRKAASEVSGEISSGAQPAWMVPAVGLLTAAAIIAGVFLVSRSPAPPPAPDESATATETIALPLQSAVADGAHDPVIDASTGDNLDTVLRKFAPLTTTSAAMATLMRLWDLDYDAESGLACEQVQQAGLRCLENRGSWSVLKQLDRPVVLTLTDSMGSDHQVVLVALAGDGADLLVGDKRVTFPVAELGELWFGHYRLFWQPPNGDDSVLRLGVQGPKVLWLRQSLAALNPDAIAPIDSDVFNDGLQQQLLEFQRRNRLVADGMAGQQTQIIINSQLGLDGTPSLSGT